MSKIPLYVQDNTKACVVEYQTDGWSGFMSAGLPEDYKIEQSLIDRCNKCIPQHIKDTDLANEEVCKITIYRFESSWKKDI